MMFRCACLAVGSLLLSFAAASVCGQEDSLKEDERRSEIEREKKVRAGSEDAESKRVDSKRAKSELEADAKHQPRQEIDRRLAEMKRRIVELRDAGKRDEAAVAEQEARAIMERFNAVAIEGLRQQIEEFRRAGRNQEAMKLESQLRERAEQDSRRKGSEDPLDRSDRPGDGSHADLERRLAHLREAAEMAAGMPEQADQLRRLAESMRERHGEPSDRPSELRELHSQLRQQDERIQRLEQIVHRLAENLERQDAGRKRKAPEGPGPSDKRNDNEK